MFIKQFFLFGAIQYVLLKKNTRGRDLNLGHADGAKLDWDIHCAIWAKWSLFAHKKILRCVTKRCTGSLI